MLNSRLRLLVLSAALAWGCGTSSLAAGGGTGTLQTPDYRIVTDESHYNLNTGEFTMPHRVKFFRPGTDATSDSATGNTKLGTATLNGNVVVHDSGNAAEAGDQAYRGGGPATLTCDKLEIDSKSKLYTATGNVHFSQGSRTGASSRAVLNRATGMLHLEGSVHMNDAGSTVSADAIDYNMNTRDIDIHGSPTIMTQPEHRAPAPAATPAKTKPKPKPSPSRKP